MTTTATGNFEVKLSPEPLSDSSADASLGRLSLAKQFHGDLEAVSQGEKAYTLTSSLTRLSSKLNSLSQFWSKEFFCQTMAAMH